MDLSVLRHQLRNAHARAVVTITCPHCFATIEHDGGYKEVCENPHCGRTIVLYTESDKRFLRTNRIHDPDRDPPEDGEC
jgi:hypothetical protein